MLYTGWIHNIHHQGHGTPVMLFLSMHLHVAIVTNWVYSSLCKFYLVWGSRMQKKIVPLCVQLCCILGGTF